MTKINRCLLYLLSLLLLLTLPGRVQAAPGSPGSPGASESGNHPSPKQRDDTVIVKFKRGISAQAKEKLHQRHGTSVGKDLASLNMQTVKLKKGMTVEEALARFKADADVEYAEPDYVIEATATPNDTYWRSGKLWGLQRINAPAAWDITTGSSETVVAVIDTGIDYNHPDLAANVWTNPGIDAGYVGDLHGIDTFNHDSDPNDDQFHGTHVSGIIGAVSDSSGVVGVNWNVKILACKFMGVGTGVLEPLSGTSTVYGYNSGAIECLNYVKTLKERGVNIVATNNSWGLSSYSQAVYDAIAAQPDILFVAAAGNSGSDNDKYPYYPASYPLSNVISVAASGQSATAPYDDTQPSWTNYSRNSIHIAAPGEGILSTVPYTSSYNSGYERGYGMQSGTSMAAPHVAGLAALLRSTGKDWIQTRNLILSGGDAVAALADTTLTGRRINAYNSLACTDRPLFALMNQPRAITAGVPVTLSAISINCGSAVGPVIATVPGGGTIELLDNGVAPDRTAGDGIFSATWTPDAADGIVSFAYPGGSTAMAYPRVALGNGWSELPLRNVGHSASGKVPLRFALHLDAAGGLFPYTWSITSGALPAGLTLNPATGEITGTPTQAASALVTFRVTDSAGYYDSAQWQITLTRDEANGWPFALSNPPAARPDAASSPVFADLDGDGKQELIVSMWNSLVVLDGYRSVRARYDFPEGTTVSTPAVSDLFRDGSSKIIVSVGSPAQTGAIYAFDKDLRLLSGFPAGKFNTTSGTPGSCSAPVIADLNSDGNKTITVDCSPDNPADPNFGKSILVTVTPQGTMLPGWPVLNGPAVGARATTEQMPVVGDLLGDGMKEVVSITSDGMLHAWSKDGNQVKQWQAATNLGDWANTNTRIWTPVLADVNGDNALEVLVKQNYFADATTQAHRISVFDKNGALLPGWPLSFPVPVAEGGIIAADLTKDGIPEIITNISSATGSQWQAFKGDGKSVAGWSQVAENTALQKKALPITGGYGGNTFTDVFYATSDTDAFLQGYSASGTTLAGYPETVALGTFVASSPAMGDVDGDGKLEIAVKAADGTVHLWKSGQYLSPFSHQWTTFAHDLEHTGSLPVLDPSQLPSSDLVVSAVSGSIAGGRLSYSVTITNTGTITAGSSFTGIYLSSDNVAAKADTLIARISTLSLPAGVSVTMTSSATIPASLAGGSYYIAALADDTGIVIERDESNNGAVVGEQLALNNDLTVSALSGTLSAGVLSYSVTVNNGGNGNANAPIALYFSDDASAENTDHLITTLSATTITGGTSKTFTGSVPVPGSTPAGTYYLAALADPANAVVEDSEANNGAAAEQFTIGNDLQVTAVSGSVSGGRLTYSVTVLNAGNVTASATSTGLYLSRLTFMEPGDFLVTKLNTAQLPPGAQTVLTGTITLPASAPTGTVHVTAMADMAGQVTESDEGNNALTGDELLLNNDLVVSAITGTLSGGMLTYAVTVENRGNANPNVPVGIYFSADDNAATSDYLVTQAQATQIAGGTSKVFNGSVTVPGSIPAGTFYLAAVADPANLVAEDDEGNNGAIGAQFSIGSDLRVTAVTGSISGGRMSYSVTVRNDGNTTAAASSTGLYLSVDDTATTADYLVTKIATGQLAPGAEAVLTGSASLAASTPAGAFYLVALADMAGVVTESDESNNGAAGNRVSVNNDITVSNVSGTLSAGVLSYSLTVTNSGNANPTLPVSLYFSTDGSVTTSDYLITQATGVSLPGGTSKTLTGSVTIPTTVPAGTFYLGALADPANVVAEDDDANNGSVGPQFSIGSDLQVTALSGSISGGRLAYSVTVKNGGDIASASSNTGIYLSADASAASSDFQVLKVTTPSLAAGTEVVLTGSFALPATTPTGSYYLAAIADMAAVIAESNEANNGAVGNQVTVNNDITVSAVSGTLSAGVLSYSFTVNNSGDANPTLPVSLYFSTDGSVTSSDHLVTQVTGISLPGGTSKTISGSVTIPSTVPAGTFYLGALADPANTVAEDDDTNNGAVGPQFTIGSDLQVTAVSGSVAGGRLTYSVTVKNSGEISSATSNTGIYLSADANATTTDYLVLKVSTPSLTAGAEIVLTGSFSLASSTPTGSFYVAAVADMAGVVTESNEANNGAVGTQLVVNNDLTVSAVSGSISNGVLTYSVTVNNSGNANPNVPVNLYFSADGVATTSDYLLTQLPQAQIAGGTSKTFTGSVTVPGSIPAGTFYLAALADPANTTTEDTENNNGAVGPQMTIGGDLQVTAVTGSISAGRLSYSVTVKNAGSTATSAASTGLYLSSDATAATSDYLVVKLATPALPAGAETVLTGSASLASSTPAGTFYLAAVADMAGVVTESDESNNGATGTQVQVKNDLTVTAVSGTLSNGMLSYSVTVNNSGNGNPSVPVTLYLSADATASTSDYVVTVAAPAVVTGGTSKTFTGTVSVPSSIPAGTYYLAAVADPANLVAEEDEANNGAVGTQLTTGSDLQVTAVTGSISAGKLTYSVTVKNAGSTNSGTSSTGVYLSRLVFTGSGDYLITKVSTAQMAPGAQLVLTGTITIPSTVPTGTFMVSGVADVNAQFVESDEGNNQLFGNQVTR